MLINIEIVAIVMMIYLLINEASKSSRDFVQSFQGGIHFIWWRGLDHE